MEILFFPQIFPTPYPWKGKGIKQLKPITVNNFTPEVPSDTVYTPKCSYKGSLQAASLATLNTLQLFP